MGSPRRVVEEMQIAAAIVPVDLAGGQNDGDWVSLKNYNHCAVIFIKEPGAVGEGPILTFEQATAVAGTGAKALPIPDGVYVKSGADLFAIGQFTKVAASTSNTYNLSAAGDNQNLIVVEFNASDLDVEGGFDCLRLKIADTGATAGQLGAALYLLSGPRHTPPPSAIID